MASSHTRGRTPAPRSSSSSSRGATSGARRRRPRVWLDKACIKQDQTDEEKQADINSLPVFLSGCRSLVVLAGPTYASRLWCAAVCLRNPKVRPPHHRPPCHRCVIELFVFLRMGGERRGSACWSSAASTSASPSTASTRRTPSASSWRTRSGCSRSSRRALARRALLAHPGHLPRRAGDAPRVEDRPPAGEQRPAADDAERGRTKLDLVLNVNNP